MSHVVHGTMDSPIGRLRLSASPQGLRSIDFAAGDAAKAPVDATLRRAITQLREYFAGQRRAFDLALDPQGTEFQRQVWQALVAIPYGETTSYGELARRIGRPAAVRAVGAANGRNPLPIIVPCHRVIGSDGSLTGYAGGLAIKRALLDLERRGMHAELAVG